MEEWSFNLDPELALQLAMDKHRKDCIAYYGQLTLTDIKPYSATAWEGIDGKGQRVILGYGLEGSQLAALGGKLLPDEDYAEFKILIRRPDGWWELPSTPVGDGDPDPPEDFATAEDVRSYLASVIIPWKG